MLIRIALKSLWNRKGSALLTIMTIVISVSLLLSVEHIRKQSKDSFGRTVSGVDLIVGARTGQINLLLSSVFRMGAGSKGISWDSFEKLASNRQVSWALPISLGDSHRGYPVLGTQQAYFEHFKYGKKQALRFSQGEAFDDDNEVVLGSDIAKLLGYSLGDSLVLSHGTGKVSFTNHSQHPFSVVGILAPTGTPVDKTLHISLAGMDAMHDIPSIHSKDYDGSELDVSDISAVFVGLKSPIATFQVQRAVNEYEGEALLAILPGVALAELWRLMGTIENILLVISALILVSSLFGMSTMLLASMRERQRELSVLRTVGAGPGTLFLLLQAEAIILSLSGCLLALLLVTVTAGLSVNWLSENYGLFMDANIFSDSTLIVIGLVMAATVVIGLIPSVNAYRQALHSGLTKQ